MGYTSPCPGVWQICSDFENSEAMEVEFLEDWLVAAASPSTLNPQGTPKKSQNPAPAARQITEVCAVFYYLLELIIM